MPERWDRLQRDARKVGEAAARHQKGGRGCSETPERWVGLQRDTRKVGQQFRTAVLGAGQHLLLVGSVVGHRDVEQFSVCYVGI